MASSISKAVAFECYYLQPAQPGQPEELKLVLFQPADTSARFLKKHVTLYTARDHVCTQTELDRIGEKIEALRAKNLCSQPGINLMQLPGLTAALDNSLEPKEQESAVQQKEETLKSQDESERKEKAQTGWQQEKWDEKGWEDMTIPSQKKIPNPEFTMDLDLRKSDLEENYAKLKLSDRQNLDELSKLLTGTFNKALHDNTLGTNYLGDLVKITKALKAHIAKPDSTTSSNLERQIIIALKKLPELAQIDSDKILALAKSTSRNMKDLVEVYITEIFARFPS